MMIKSTILFLSITILGVSAYAQQSRVFIKGGLNIANVSTTDNGHVDDANALASFHVGMMADLPLGKYVAIQPALLFTGKGAKTQSGNSGSSNYYKATSNPHYLELPLNVLGKIPLSDKKSNFFLGAGPYLAVGIGGKNKSEGTTGIISYNGSEKIKFSNDAPETFNEQEGAGFGIMRRFDYGLNATAGFELNTFLMSLNYGYGLAKINSVGENDNDRNKHRVLSFSIGFKL
jgi:hypothetical protein